MRARRIPRHALPSCQAINKTTSSNNKLRDFNRKLHRLSNTAVVVAISILLYSFPLIIVLVLKFQTQTSVRTDPRHARLLNQSATMSSLTAPILTIRIST